ncbi:hypothetical protein CEXT_156791 [Caerostris extrusa]|uniref:Uncharacterized protein n=1 Tax=Caerostris extrusa TaxID=172846 RepID=A0AAV4NYT5_CAEEX|nr:hypothetical protein CEXT_156791 [Caerostris extrusa]
MSTIILAASGTEGTEPGSKDPRFNLEQLIAGPDINVKMTFHFTKPPRGGICATCDRNDSVNSLENYTLREILRTNGGNSQFGLDKTSASKITFHFTKPSAWGICATCDRNDSNEILRELSVEGNFADKWETHNLALDPSTETAFIYEGPNHLIIKVKPKKPPTLYTAVGLEDTPIEKAKPYSPPLSIMLKSACNEWQKYLLTKF